MISNNAVIILASIFLAINCIAFFIMLADKIQSRKNGAERISEGMLFFMATIFAAFGVYIGMFTFRHKTRKWYFLIGIPFLIIQNIALIYLIYLYIGTSFFTVSTIDKVIF